MRNYGKHIALLFLYISILPLTLDAHHNNAVIPEYSGGRFGDNLIAFSHALYAAEINHCKLFLPPFPYSDQLMMSTFIPPYSADIDKQYQHKLYHMDRSAGITFKLPYHHEVISESLLIVPFFPYKESVEYAGGTFHSFFVDWENASFKNKLRALITPKQQLQLITPPPGKLSVAVHIRKGGSFDTWTDRDRQADPTIGYRSPLDAYYIEQIRLIAALFKEIPLYVYLFTDDNNPQALAEYYNKEVGMHSITYEHRKKSFDKKDTVLEDFFSMTLFDILIRPQSNFSIMAEQIGFHDIVISPGALLADSGIPSGMVTFKRPFHKIQAEVASLLGTLT